MSLCETPGQDVLVVQQLALMSEVAVVGEVSCDWLQSVGGRDSVVVLKEPPMKLLDAFWVFREFGQKCFKLFPWDEARKGSVAVPVPQQSL